VAEGRAAFDAKCQEFGLTVQTRSTDDYNDVSPQFMTPPSLGTATSGGGKQGSSSPNENIVNKPSYYAVGAEFAGLRFGTIGFDLLRDLPPYVEVPYDGTATTPTAIEWAANDFSQSGGGRVFVGIIQKPFVNSVASGVEVAVSNSVLFNTVYTGGTLRWADSYVKPLPPAIKGGLRKTV
jgi:hypothetical protein